MNDIGRFHLVTSGDLGVADVTTGETLTGDEQFRPSGIVNRPIDATAAEQRRIRGIYNGVNL
jgi:hypothetical protein